MAPWRDQERLRRFSPMTYVENIHTPLLILHSDRTCAARSRKARALQRAQIPGARDEVRALRGAVARTLARRASALAGDPLARDRRLVREVQPRRVGSEIDRRGREGRRKGDAEERGLHLTP